MPPKRHSTVPANPRLAPTSGPSPTQPLLSNLLHTHSLSLRHLNTPFQPSPSIPTLKLVSDLNSKGWKYLRTSLEWEGEEYNLPKEMVTEQDMTLGRSPNRHCGVGVWYGPLGGQDMSQEAQEEVDGIIERLGERSLLGHEWAQNEDSENKVESSESQMTVVQSPLLTHHSTLRPEPPSSPSPDSTSQLVDHDTSTFVHLDMSASLDRSVSDAVIPLSINAARFTSPEAARVRLPKDIIKAHLIGDPLELAQLDAEDVATTDDEYHMSPVPLSTLNPGIFEFKEEPEYPLNVPKVIKPELVFNKTDEDDAFRQPDRLFHRRNSSPLRPHSTQSSSRELGLACLPALSHTTKTSFLRRSLHSDASARADSFILGPTPDWQFARSIDQDMSERTAGILDIMNILVEAAQGRSHVDVGMQEDETPFEKTTPTNFDLAHLNSAGDRDLDCGDATTNNTAIALERVPENQCDKDQKDMSGCAWSKRRPGRLQMVADCPDDSPILAPIPPLYGTDVSVSPTTPMTPSTATMDRRNEERPIKGESIYGKMSKKEIDRIVANIVREDAPKTRLHSRLSASSTATPPSNDKRKRKATSQPDKAVTRAMASGKYEPDVASPKKSRLAAQNIRYVTSHPSSKTSQTRALTSVGKRGGKCGVQDNENDNQSTASEDPITTMDDVRETITASRNVSERHSASGRTPAKFFYTKEEDDIIASQWDGVGMFTGEIVTRMKEALASGGYTRPESGLKWRVRAVLKDRFAAKRKQRRGLKNK